jgi:transcription elongation factor GreA
VDKKADDAFVFGRTAEVLDEGNGKVNTWTLVGRTEADLKEGKMSAESPVGKALLNAPLGETVKVETPGGAKKYVVQKLVG